MRAQVAAAHARAPFANAEPVADMRAARCSLGAHGASVSLLPLGGAPRPERAIGLDRPKNQLAPRSGGSSGREDRRDLGDAEVEPVRDRGRSRDLPSNVLDRGETRGVLEDRGQTGAPTVPDDLGEQD